MQKRLIGTIITIAIILLFIPALPTQASTTVNIGDYVVMGKYYDEPILWRCVDIDENGPLMLSDKILSIKPFDAKGSHKYVDGTAQADVNNYRTNYGSNLWETSNMRSWLNSTATAGNVTWLDDCSPTADKFLYNDYADEKGFLSEGNFVASEQSAIKSVTQKSLLYYRDETKLRQGGRDYHTYNQSIATVVQNYDDAYYHNVTDKMFLLDVKQLNKVYQNSETLGTDYYIGKPTQQAVDNSGFKYSELSTDKYWTNWNRSPYSLFFDPSSVRYVYSDGSVRYSSANDYFVGARPAFYLNLSSVSFKSGNGTLGTPYVVGTFLIEKHNYDIEMIALALSKFTENERLSNMKGVSIQKYVDEKRHKQYTEFNDKIWNNSDLTYSKYYNDIVGDWVIKNVKDDPETGLYAVAYRNENKKKTIITYRGVDPDTVPDWGTVLEFGIMNKFGTSFRQALEFYNDNKDESTIVSGHSLGGALASYVSMMTGVQAITVNAATGHMIDDLYVDEKLLGSAKEYFTGVDSWNYTNSITQTKDAFNKLVAYYESDQYKTNFYKEGSLEGLGDTWGHSILSLIQYNADTDMFEYTQKVTNKDTFSDSLDLIYWTGFFQPTVKYWNGTGDVLCLGTSADDVIRDARYITNTTRGSFLLGGDGNDDIVSVYKSGKSLFIGGRGNDTLGGSDTADVYYYTKGDGLDTIYDLGGNDKIYLSGFNDSDIINVDGDFDKDFILIDINNQTFMKVSKDRNYNMYNSFEVEVNGKVTKIQNWNKWVRSRTVVAKCPVIMEIYDQTNNLVMTLGNSEEKSDYTNFGYFHVTKEIDGDNFIKIATLYDDSYSIKLIGTDTGTMDYSVEETVENGNIISYAAKNIPITPTTIITTTIDTSTNPILIVDRDGAGNNTSEIPLTVSTFVPVMSIELSATQMNIDVGETLSLNATITPNNATNTAVQWISNDSSIVTVDENGNIKGNRTGAATIIATTLYGGHSASCEITVSPHKTALTSAVNDARTLIGSKTIGTAVGNVSQEAHDAYNSAITSASAVNDKLAATQEEIDAAVTGLATATTAFNNAVIINNNANDIISFTVPVQIAGSTINSTSHTVTFLEPYGSDVTNLIPTITLSTGATISPASGVAKNFTDPVSYMVTAQDGTSQTWTVTCIVVRPTVITINPADKSSNVPINPTITIEFNEQIYAMGGITLTDSKMRSVSYNIKNSPDSTKMLLITPKANLKPLEKYTLTIAKDGIVDLYGSGLSKPFTSSFSTSTLLMPMVKSISPADNADNVKMNSRIKATFNEKVLKGDGFGSIKLEDDLHNLVDITTTLSGTSLTITPKADLKGSTLYTITIPKDAVKDNASMMVEESVTQFTTEVDKTAPVIKTTTPIKGSKEVSVSTDITLTFSEMIKISDPDLTGFKLTDKSKKSLSFTAKAEGNVLTITPTTALDLSMPYTLVIPTAGVADIVGNLLKSPYTLSFTTTDGIAPAIKQSSPKNTGANAKVNSPITVTYTKNIFASGSLAGITIKDADGYVIDGALVDKSIKNNVLTIKSKMDLRAGVQYTLTIPKGTLMDSAGNARDEDDTITFTTGKDNVGPTVISTSPANNALDVTVNSNIQITFSEDVQSLDASKVTLTYKDAKGKSVNVSNNQAIVGNVLILTPEADLAKGVKYTLILKPGAVKDMAANKPNSLTGTITINFTTVN